MRVVGSIFAISVALASSCSLDLEGASCPCAAGYECCESLNVCQASGEFCPQKGAGGTNAASGGVPSRGGTASAGSASGGTATTAGGTASVTAGTGNAGTPASGGNPAGGGTSSSSGGAPSFAGAPLGNGGLPGEAGAGGEIAGSGGEGGLGTPPCEPHFSLVATQHNDNARTGANLDERALKRSNVNLQSFGELSRRALRGAVFAQPLVAPRLPMGGSTHDVVYVATMANVVYALDARDSGAAPLWITSLVSPINLPDPSISLGASGIWHEVGVLSTPVISLADNSLYVVAATKTANQYSHVLYALALDDGHVKNSTTIASDSFEAAPVAQISALSFANGSLHVLFGAYEATSTVSGWAFTYDSKLALRRATALGNPGGAGVTMTGQGAAIDDSGALFFSTNPVSPPPVDPAVPALGGSLVGFLSEPPGGPTRILFPNASISSHVNELGSSGPLLVPGSDRIVALGQHRAYVVSRDGGHALVQTFRPSGSGDCTLLDDWCTIQQPSPIFWPGSEPAPTPRLFAWSPNDRLLSFRYDAETGTFPCADESHACTPLAASPPGESDDIDNHVLASAANLSVSSNGTAEGSGVVWAVHPYTQNPLRNSDGILRAYDAEDLSFLWSSEDTGNSLGAISPGTTPTVSGGRVFVGTVDGISNKHIFWNDGTTDTPAITNFADRYLVLAWSIPSNETRGFQLTWSTDGSAFNHTSSLFDPGSRFEPGLAASDSQIFLAWLSSDDLLKVAAANDPAFLKPQYLTQRTPGNAPVSLAYKATTAPALAYGNQRLFLAFHDNTNLHVVSSGDAVSFDTSRETVLSVPISYQAPSLSYVNGKLYVLTTSSQLEVNLYVSSDDGKSFVGPTLLPLTSAGHPALLTYDNGGDGRLDYYVVWTDITDTAHIEGRLKVASSFGDLTHFGRVHEFAEDEATYSIAATLFRGEYYLAWLGVTGATHPNVARYSPGELVTYGLLAR